MAAGGHHVLKAYPFLWVQAGGGLVEEEHLRVPQKGLGDARPAHHASGEGLHPAARPVAEVYQVQHPADLLFLLPFGQPLQGGQVLHHLGKGQLPEHAEALGQVAGVLPALDGAAV